MSLTQINTAPVADRIAAALAAPLTGAKASAQATLRYIAEDYAEPHEGTLPDTSSLYPELLVILPGKSIMMRGPLDVVQAEAMAYAELTGSDLIAIYAPDSNVVLLAQCKKRGGKWGRWMTGREGFCLSLEPAPFSTSGVKYDTFFCRGGLRAAMTAAVQALGSKTREGMALTVRDDLTGAVLASRPHGAKRWTHY